MELKTDPAYPEWLQKAVYDGLAPFYEANFPGCPASPEAFLVVVHAWVKGLSAQYTWEPKDATKIARAFNLLFLAAIRFPVPYNFIHCLNETHV